MTKYYSLLLLATLLILLNVYSQAQIRTVKGTLMDPQSGTPLPGVNIVVKGTAQGTTTDSNGYYELKAPVGATLVISYIGYTTQEVIVPPLTDQETQAEKHLQAQLDSLKQEQAKIKTYRHTIPDSPEDKTLSPYFFVQSDDPTLDAMPLHSTSASVNISGVIAEILVKQVYINQGKKSLEAVYIFPGSTRAAVYGMSMQVGKRHITAKIQEKQQAREQYEQAIHAGKTATLLEQKRPNVFQMNVGNILPNDTITVELRYTELLTATDGTYAFVYPTVVGPHYSETPDDAAHTDEKWVQNPYLTEGKAPTYDFNLTTRLNAGLPIQKVFSPSHQVNITFADKNTAQISLDPTEKTGGNRDFVLRYRLRGGQVESGLLLHPGEEENFFLLMMQPPDKPTLAQIPPREYVFILDVSGSMHGFPLDVSKELMQKLLTNMRPEDRFNVILFAGMSSIFSEDESVEANEGNISRAIAFINRQKGSGSTSLLPALQRALALKGTEGYARTFALITDGYVDVEKRAFELVRQHLNEANFFAFGIGSSVNRYLIEGLAHTGMGEPFFASNEREARKVGNEFIELLEHPVLTNIQLDFGGLDVYDVEPTSIPDVFAGRPIIVFGKYKGTAQGTIRLNGLSGHTAYTQKIEIASARSDHNQALRYLWARERIKYWDDYASFFEDNSSYYNATGKGPHTSKLQQNITQLGLKYNLLTAYTSFIAVDSLVRTEGSPIEVKQPLPLPQGVSNYALSGAIAGVQVRGFSPVMGLTPDIQSLSEVVVTCYGMQTKKDITASISTISSNNFQPTPSGSIEQTLQGRVSGVVAQQNAGVPGGSTSVRIRGNTSLALSNSPLYIVDGIRVDNSESGNGTGGFDNANRMSDFSLGEIESIQVIKGPSATALYGSQGVGGVVVITTKNFHNKWGKYPQVAFTSSISAEQVNRLPQLQTGFAQGRPLAGELSYQAIDEPFSWGPRIADLAVSPDGQVVPHGLNAGRPLPVNQPASFFRNGLTIRNQLSVGHNKDRYRWNISAGNQYQKGILPTTYLQRNSLKLTGEKTWGKLKLDGMAWYTHTHSRQTLRGNNPSGILLSLLATPPTFINDVGYQLEDGSQRQASDWFDNPYWTSQKNRQQTGLHRLVSKIGARYDLGSNLQLAYHLNMDRFTDERQAGVDVQSAGQPIGNLMQRKEQFLHWQSALIVNYQKQWQDFSLQTSGGVTYRETKRNVNRTDGTGLLQAGDFSLANASSLTIMRQDFLQRNTSFMGKASLNWRSAVNLDLGMTHELTTTLPKGYLFSPLAGLSVQLTELLPVYSQVVNSGKVFTSIGRIAKEAPLFIDANLPLATASIDQVTYNFERVATQNTLLTKPEINRSWEIGTEWQLFDGRLTLQGVYYHTLTQNLYVPIFNQSTVYLKNGGSLENKGVEIDLQVTPLRTQYFSWNTGVHFTRYQSLVKELAVERVALAGFSTASSNLIEGQPYGVLYGTRYQHTEQGELSIGKDGFPLVAPTSGILGNPNPDWLASVESNLEWKGLQLSFLFDYQKGGVKWNGTQSTLDYLGTSATSGKQRSITGYVFAGVNPEGALNTTLVNFSDTESISNNRWVRYGKGGIAEAYIERASSLRLRQVQLTYNFNQAFLNRIKLDKASLGIFAHNLWMSTPYTGVDPETNLTGNSNGRALDYFNTPNVRSFGVSLHVGL
ncbi:SusC/RagA family TonB-linked outer membrane protein [Rhodocytophaga rosea]|uniref:SusC/RagA family TonB-linked outer membrane protein n=1 Tax=Rhodocytophaga rosea TaxID=2704465 RepID=A0A6C0GFG1_9BACT|nr:SusC/RagA family TonB-linked outer membrane protein [Rhodocytophaga rosea]QHT66420.1 SusC/RagA family TonB-linked outer membrane protein [Rhodocytophaga rosea]